LNTVLLRVSDDENCVHLPQENASHQELASAILRRRALAV